MLAFLFCILVLFGGCCCDPRGDRVKRIVGGAPAQLPPADDPTVYLRFAGKTAAIKGALDTPHYVFRGIRFGYKPTGKDRFQRPRQYFLEGNIDATIYPPPCLQPIPGDRKVIGSEDCLFLNVFTPDLPDGTEGLPVIIWIHGGNFRYGSASQYGVRNLVGKRLVLVTIQYRLGTLGFLSTGTPELPGNAALWDMALAVQWVRNYIGFFGGNPHQIVVMGQGTGGSSALLVALSNIAKGTVSAVVSMSGTAVSHWALEHSPQTTARDIAEYHGCPTGTTLTMIKCLQNLPGDSIIEGDTQLEQSRLMTRGFVSGLNGLLGPAPNTENRFDGRSLPPAIDAHPLDDMTEGNIPDIPLLTGITKDETAKAVHGHYKNEIITKLTSVPNFLDKVLIQHLQLFTGLGRDNKTSSTLSKTIYSVLDPLHFRGYVQVQKNNLQEGLTRIAEATSDALFSLPAFLTANLWSKKNSKTFLYRFEHAGNGRKGKHFLRGSPLVANDSVDHENIVGHGDELGYLFEARNLDGSPLPEPENLSEEDLKMRETFTQIIADFARNGKIIINNKEVQPFSGDKNNFIQISTTPKTSENFKFCEMGLWAGLSERLKTKTCQFLNVINTGIKSAENLFFDTINATSLNKLGPVDISGTGQKISSALNPGNVLGGLGGLVKNRRKEEQPNNMIPPIGFLG